MQWTNLDANGEPLSEEWRRELGIEPVQETTMSDHYDEVIARATDAIEDLLLMLGVNPHERSEDGRSVAEVIAGAAVRAALGKP